MRCIRGSQKFRPSGNVYTDMHVRLSIQPSKWYPGKCIPTCTFTPYVYLVQMNLHVGMHFPGRFSSAKVHTDMQVRLALFYIFHLFISFKMNGPCIGDKFVYTDRQGNSVNFHKQSCSLKEPTDSDSFCCYSSRNYHCLYAPRAAASLKELQLFPNWIGKCESECEKTFHLDCYYYNIKEKNLTHLLEKKENNIYCKIVCGAGCHKKLASLLLKASSNTSGNRWVDDGPNGKDDKVNSLSILLEWLATEPNYSDYRGNQDNNQGISKDHYAKKILALMKSKGIKTERSVDSVHNKIKEISNKWLEADSFKNGTGNGILNDAENSADDVKIYEAKNLIEKEILRRCSYYYLLEEVMNKQAYTVAKFTSDDNNLLISTIDSEDDDDTSSIEIMSSMSSSTKRSINSVQQSSEKKQQETPKTATVRRKILESTLSSSSEKSQGEPKTAHSQKLSMNDVNASQKKLRKTKGPDLDDANFINQMFSNQHSEIMQRNALESRKLDLDEKRFMQERKMHAYEKARADDEYRRRRRQEHVSWLASLVAQGIFQSIDEAEARYQLDDF